jgi:hypothetical protein
MLTLVGVATTIGLAVTSCGSCSAAWNVCKHLDYRVNDGCSGRRWANICDTPSAVDGFNGVSDQIFSVNDTEIWYRGLQAANKGDASNFARFFRVPGMSVVEVVSSATALVPLK